MPTRREACMGLGATAIAGVSWDRTPPLASDEYGAALARLDPHWSWLVDLLSVIRAAEPGEIPDSAAAGLLVRPNGYVAVMNASGKSAFVASLIAHEAWHAYQHSQGRRYYGRAAEQEAWALQAVVMADLLPGNLAVPWLLSEIATLPDGGPLHGNPEV